MSYHILEVQKVDEGGNHIPPSDFYVVDDTGKKVSERLGSIEDAMRKLLELETEKSRKKDNDRER